MSPAMTLSQLDIPTHCKAGVVVNEGPNFEVKVEMVPVPKPGECAYIAPREETEMRGMVF